MDISARQLFTTVTEDRRLTLTIEPIALPDLADDEVLVEMKAVPINPSDLGLLLAPADMQTLRPESVNGHPALVADVAPPMMRAMKGRIGQKLPAGNEGAGVVVAAGASGQALIGRVVSLVGGRAYCTHRVTKLRECAPLPEGAEPVEGASLFVNPLTVLGFLETMKREGHTAIVHTAAASNLGRMLTRRCVQQGVPLVGIVRSPEQAQILTELGINHAVDSSRDDFMPTLIEAILDTGATLGFDAIGGGKMANSMLVAMEQAQLKSGAPFSVYGSNTHKQVYIYGRLDPSPTTLTASYGFAWSLGGWLLTPFLQSVGRERAAELRQIAVDERNGVFRSHYTRTISLEEMIDPEIARHYQRKATGEKFLVDPNPTR